VEQTESQVSDLQNAYNNLIKEIVICERSYHGRITKVVREAERTLMKMFECGEWEGPLTTISTKLKQDLKNEGFTIGQLDNIHRIVQPEHRDPKFKSSHLTASEFEEAEESVFDQVEEFAQRTLSDKQLDKLSVAERKEVLEQEIGSRKSRKTIDNDRIKHLQEYAAKANIKLVDKVTKQLPPEQFRGQTESYYVLEELERQHEILSNMFKDLKQQVYNFKPTTETEKKALAELEQYFSKTFVPYCKVAIELTEGTKTIMRNITDEKYSDTNRAWMRNAEDKFLSYGNHGSGEVNAVLTNKVVLKLGNRDIKDDEGNVINTVPVIIKTSIKRETTREEEGDKCLFKIDPGQVHIQCPECGLKYNKPIITEEQRDIIAGDLFHQAKTTLLANGLSNAIDYWANNVVTEPVQDPMEWFKQKYGNKYPDITPEIIEDTEKIKDVDIDPKDLTEKRHGMLRNAATRRLEKAQHFSDNS